MNALIMMPNVPIGGDVSVSQMRRFIALEQIDSGTN